MNTLKQAQALHEWGVKHRRYLHQYPETSLNEKATSQYCKKILSDLGYTIKDSWGYGFTADLIIHQSYPTIAWRADMDALPIQEKNVHDFVSKNKNVAHMCGHDVHMTIALTAANLLATSPSQAKNNIRFLFQPSEEKPPGGAIGMIEQNCLEGVDEVYGLHNDSGTMVGKMWTRVGPLMASGDLFEIQIIGRGGHAARPQDCLDPISPCAQLISNWQSITARRINPLHSAVLSVTKILAGDTFNVIPDSAMVAGTIRTFDQVDRELIVKLMQDSLLPLQAAGYQCKFNYKKGYDAVVNHDKGVKRVSEAARVILGVENVDEKREPAMWSEDFGYFLQHRPGAFIFLGSGNPTKNISAPLHSANFDVDESVIAMGAAIVAQLISSEHYD